MVEEIRHALEDAIGRDIFVGSYRIPWIGLVVSCWCSITYAYTVTSGDGPIQVGYLSERLDSTTSSDDAMNE